MQAIYTFLGKLRKSDAGFSLPELSIGLIIIGLLIGAGALFAGKKLIDKARVTNVARNINEYVSAFQEFKQRYGYLPGDYPHAKEMIDGALNNGQGNGIVDGDALAENAEALQFWAHLAKAGLVSNLPGKFEGAGVFGKNIPKSDFGGGFGVIDNPHGWGGLWIVLGEKKDDKCIGGLLTRQNALAIANAIGGLSDNVKIAKENGNDEEASKKKEFALYVRLD